jgi:hypothetical protein
MASSADVTRSLMDLTLTIGELKQAVVGLEQSNRRIEDRIDKFDNKVEARFEKVEGKVSTISKHLFAAWVVMAVVLTVSGWAFKEVWDLAKPLLKEKLTTSATPTTVLPVAPPLPAPASVRR